MTLSSEALLAALKSASSSSGSSTASSYDTDEVVMKLAKKNQQALLSFEINGSTMLGRKVRVTHDVKIEVMKPAEVERMKEPMCPEPDVRCVWVASVVLLLTLCWIVRHTSSCPLCRNYGRL